MKIITTFLFSFLVVVGYSQTVVNSLAELRSAVVNSNQNIVMNPGNYDLTDLPSGSRVIECSGSNNTIDLTGVHVTALVGEITATYITMSGSNNTWIGGEFEDVYYNGMTEVTDFIAYNQDTDNLASGLNGGDRNVILNIWGADNLFKDLKLTTRGSFPYGYGSMYGINNDNTFGLDKRGGILITSPNVTLDGIEIQHRSFSHAIIMQDDADNTIIKNCLVEGAVRSGSELYEEGEGSLPYLSDYLMPQSGNKPIDADDYFSLSEDGIRSYTGSGSVTVENCTVKKMRGGIRLYLASSATVSNSQAIDCGSTNWNLPANATVTNSSGNFAYAPLSDFRLSKNNQDIEWTIIPSPHATGPHNIADVLGNNHNIVFHRTPGPVDADEERAIVISGDNSTIINETEYTIILEASASGNKITTCGRVLDYGSNNTLSESSSCSIALGCYNTTENLQAECYNTMSGVVIQDITGVINEKGITAIENNDWIAFEDVDLTETIAVNVTAATVVADTSVEVRVGSVNGPLLAIIPIANTTSYDTSQDFSVDLNQGFDGETDVYFVFKGAAGALLNVDKMSFEYSPCYVASYEATTVTNAKDFCEASEVAITTNTNAIEVVNDINDGDYLRFSNVNFRLAYNTVKVSAASGASGGTIEVRSGGLDGILITTIEVDNTGDWNTYNVFEGYLTSDFTGLHDLYIVFTGDSGTLLNLESFQFFQDDCVEYLATNIEVNVEDFCDNSGATIKNANEGGQYISAVKHGDYFGYGIFDFNTNQLNAFEVTIGKSSTKDTFVGLYLDSPRGTLIATVDVSETTGGSQNWKTSSTSSIAAVTGLHKLYVVFTGQTDVSLINFNTFQLITESLSVGETPIFNGTVLFPNPATEAITIRSAKNAVLEIYNLNGSLLMRKQLTTEDALINLSNMASGLYLFKLKSNEGIEVKKVVKL